MQNKLSCGEYKCYSELFKGSLPVFTLYTKSFTHTWLLYKQLNVRMLHTGNEAVYMKSKFA